MAETPTAPWKDVEAIRASAWSDYGGDPLCYRADDVDRALAAERAQTARVEQLNRNALHAQRDRAIAAEREVKQQAETIRQLQAELADERRMHGENRVASAENTAELHRQIAVIDAARYLLQRDRAFQEWAQGYLDGGRWAGHDRADAVRQELLERDARCARLTAALRGLRRVVAQTGTATVDEAIKEADAALAAAPQGGSTK